MPSVDDAVAAEDERALARYRYLLRTAPPEQIEQAHAEAYAQLSEQQRQKLLAQLSHDLPPGEAPRTDRPDELARAATRAELRNPGYLTGPSFAGHGTLFAGNMMSTIAGVVIGTTIAQSSLTDHGADYAQSPEAVESGDQQGEPADGPWELEGTGGSGQDGVGPGGDQGGWDGGGFGDGGGFDVGGF